MILLLIKCPECNLQISDKAVSCPHCGLPLQVKNKTRKPRNKNNKYRRLPNGFGQISKIQNKKLRNPYRVMISVGKDKNGRPVCKPLKPQTYFPTYNEAYSALMEYNKNPYDLSPSITVEELYERWIDVYKASVKNAFPLTIAWKYCSAVYTIQIKNLRARHIKMCIEEGVMTVNKQERKTTAATKRNIKTLFNKLLDYAVEYDLIDKNVARTFSINNAVTKEISHAKKPHLAFTKEEMDLLWSHLEDEAFTDVLLVQCYSGWRPLELCQLQLKNVDLENWFFTGGMKTDSGINRVVPIHSKIRHIVKQKYNEAQSIGSMYLFNHNGLPLTYLQYRKRFQTIIKDLDMNPEHRPHDARKHFITIAKKYNVDEYAIKYIVGHVIKDLTERVYTERELSWLQSEIEKIK